MKSALFLAALLAGCSGAGAAPLLIDKPHSRVEVVVKATVDSFTGHLADYEATIDVDPATSRVNAAVFRFHIADVRTGKSERDHQMLVWEESDRFPDGSFTLSSLQAEPDGHVTALGKLTFHGIEQDLRFPASVSTDGTLFAIDGEADLDTRQFGLPVIRKFGLLKVDPLVKIRFHLQGTLPKT
jgi:polyisoprenoid-binding protein YceI